MPVIRITPDMTISTLNRFFVKETGLHISVYENDKKVNSKRRITDINKESCMSLSDSPFKEPRHLFIINLNRSVKEFEHVIEEQYNLKILIFSENNQRPDPNKVLHDLIPDNHASIRNYSFEFPSLNAKFKEIENKLAKNISDWNKTTRFVHKETCFIEDSLIKLSVTFYFDAQVYKYVNNAVYTIGLYLEFLGTVYQNCIEDILNKSDEAKSTLLEHLLLQSGMTAYDILRIKSYSFDVRMEVQKVYDYSQ